MSSFSSPIHGTACVAFWKGCQGRLEQVFQCELVIYEEFMKAYETRPKLGNKANDICGLWSSPI